MALVMCAPVATVPAADALDDEAIAAWLLGWLAASASAHHASPVWSN
jgi:hypothetical protein